MLRGMQLLLLASSESCVTSIGPSHLFDRTGFGCCLSRNCCSTTRLNLERDLWVHAHAYALILIRRTTNALCTLTLDTSVVQSTVIVDRDRHFVVGDVMCNAGYDVTSVQSSYVEVEPVTASQKRNIRHGYLLLPSRLTTSVHHHLSRIVHYRRIINRQL